MTGLDDPARKASQAQSTRIHGVVSLDRIADMTKADLTELGELSVAVPDSSADWPGRALEWAVAEWCARARDDNRRLTSVTGVVLRQGTRDGQPALIGGIGGVKTHPAARRQGYAATTLRRAVEFLYEQADVAFGLLVCEPHMIAYYSRLGWREFGGRLLVRSFGLTAEFAVARVMTRDIGLAGPTTGTIDICGPPW